MANIMVFTFNKWNPTIFYFKQHSQSLVNEEWYHWQLRKSLISVRDSHQKTLSF